LDRRWILRSAGGVRAELVSVGPRLLSDITRGLWSVKKKLAAAAGLVALMSLGGGVAFAWVAGQPNIATVSATFDLKSQGPLAGKSCHGPGPAKDIYE